MVTRDGGCRGVYLVNYGLLRAAGGDQRGQLLGLEAWQVMLGVMVVPSVAYGLLSFAIPESPRHLISVGRRSEACEVLSETEGRDIDLDVRVAEIERAMRSEHTSTFRDLLGGGAFFRRIVWIGIGRRPFALVGSAGMVIGLALEAWAFSFDLVNGRLPATQGWVAPVAAHFFVLCFALSWGVVVWVFLGEMFPNRIRAAALGVAASAQWIANWVINASFPSLSGRNLAAAHVIYTIFAALSIPFVLRFVQETKGRALEEMG